MADSAVSFLLETLANLVIDEAKFSGKVKTQVEQLQNELELMQSFLIDAEAKNDKQELVRKWVSQFKEVAYDVEDLLESYAFNIGSKKPHGIRRFVGCVSDLPQTHELGSQIEPLMSKITNLKESLKGYAGITDIVVGRHEVGSTKMKLRRSYSHVVEKDFVGLESNVEELVEHLVRKRYRFVSIWGMGGLGKTTLAQKIYNHGRVRSHFESTAWVCISKDDWTVSGILKTILLKIGGIRGEEMDRMSDDELVRKLYDAQSGRKCLVVLDDIWGTEAWECIKPAFHVNTKVLLTTRNEKVAEIELRHGFIYQPRLLNDEECWELLQKKSINKDFADSEDVRVLGMKMIKHCGGLPLAVIVLGGVLSTKQTLDEWKEVNRNIKHYLVSGKKDTNQVGALDEIFSLSYDNLPYRLKSCFLYMAAYREDEFINVERLYHLWISEGLVSEKDKYGDEMLICVAERYLGELAQRSMVQVQSRNFSNVLKFWSCRLHDIMRDLSLKKAKEENFLHVIDERTRCSSSSSTCKMRRVRMSINHSSNQPWHLPGRMVKSTRSLQLCFKDNWRSQLSKTNLDNFPLLRSLVVECIRQSKYDFHVKSLRNLSHLRYLCASGYVNEVYWTSLSKLEHLQTLDLRNIRCWYTTSTVLHNQTKLKYLHLPPMYKVKCGYSLLPTKKLRLDSLRELERLINFNSDYCEVKDLSKLTKLREVSIKLQSNGLNCIVDVMNNLNNLQFLDHLYVTISGSSFEEDKHFSCNIQKSLADSSSTFLRALKELQLNDFKFDEDFVEAIEKLPNLRQLGFFRCKGIRELICHSNGFPQLQFLKLEYLNETEKWRVDEGGMPNLSHLHIENCTKLKMFPEGLIKSLKEIYLIEMSEEFSEYVESASGQQGANFNMHVLDD